jgi:PhnB protein
MLPQGDATNVIRLMHGPAPFMSRVMFINFQPHDRQGFRNWSCQPEEAHREVSHHRKRRIPKEQAMQVNPYLFYNGNCEAALKYYEKVLGAKIEAMLTHEEAPESMPIPPDWKKKIMHAKISIDGEVIMASDAPPGHFHQPQGFSVSLTVADHADGERKFKALAEGGTVNMPYSKTFWAKGFGMCVDQFGIPWMVNCPAEGM